MWITYHLAGYRIVGCLDEYIYLVGNRNWYVFPENILTESFIMYQIGEISVIRERFVFPRVRPMPSTY